MCMSDLLTHVSVYHVYALVPFEESVRFPGTGVLDGCEPPHGCWE